MVDFPPSEDLADQEIVEAAAVEDDGVVDFDTPMATALGGQSSPAGTFMKDDFEISRTITELTDNKGHFRIHPETDPAGYPSRREAFEKLSELHVGFSKVNGFAKVAPIDGDMYYFVSLETVRHLSDWLQENETDPNLTILAIDNSDLVENGTRSKVKKHSLDSRAQFVSSDVWKQLINWFGGGPEIGIRACLDTMRMVRVDTAGKLLRVVVQDDVEHFRRFFFSTHEKMKDAKSVMCEVLGIDPEKCRFHDFYKHKPFTRLDSARDLKGELGNKHLMDDNLIFIEFPDDEGNYLIKYTTKGGYMVVQQNDVIEATSAGYGKGVVGLRNLGNTCYMNSILQSLSSIPMLKNAFLSKQYEQDINMNNVLGYQGKLANAFAKLLEKMWSGQGSIVAPHGFKRIIAETKQDFAGYEQHDSQEFLSELLDGLHEDLNRVKTKPIVETVQQNGRPDVVVAAESLQTYKMRNDSVISDLFTGLYKSTVTCPDAECGNVSVTFDPFMILPLPLQSGEKPYHVLHIVHVPLDPNSAPIPLDLIVPKHGPLLLLKEIIKDKVGITEKNKQNAELLLAGKLPTAALDPNTKIAQIYTLEDPELATMHDILLFQARDGRLIDLFMDTGILSRVSQSHSIVSYETFNEKRFENFVFQPDEDWKRSLETPREKRGKKRVDDDYEPRSASDDESNDGDAPRRVPVAQAREIVRDEDREIIGVSGCPFLIGDVWHGNYNFSETDQILRMEILDVVQLQWGDYLNYVQDALHTSNGIPQEETNMTEEEFNDKDVFHIRAIADTKEKIYHPSLVRGRTLYQSAFELKGLFISTGSLGPSLEDKLKQSVRKSVKDLRDVGDNSSKDGEQKSQGDKSDNSNDVNVKKKEEKGKSNKFGPIGGILSGASKRFKGKPKLSIGNETDIVKTSNKKASKGGEKSKTDDKSKDGVAKKGSFVEVEKKGGKSLPKPSTRDQASQKKTGDDNLFKMAEQIKSGVIESKYLCGKVILRPTNKRQKIPVTNHTNYYVSHQYAGAGVADEESREPIILNGVVDNNHQYFWGKFIVDQGFNKGEFSLQKFESMNWGSSLIQGTNNRQVDIRAKTRYTRPNNQDNRLLILLAHRIEGRSFKYGSIPEAFFIPVESTESELMDCLKAKFRAYLHATLKAEGKNAILVDPETNEEEDQVETILQELKVIRSNSKFVTAYHHSERLMAGKQLRHQSDQPVKVDEDDFFVWFVCDWPEQVPFEPVRAQSVFTPLPNEDSKMTLFNAMELFSRTEKLNALNAWYCSNCKNHQEASKQLQIWSLPPVLVIQFKRFSQEEGRSTADKLEIAVDFPFDMDLKDFALSYKIIEQESKSGVPETVANATAQLADFEYELIAVSSHVGGGLGFGHYIASAKNESTDSWFDFNDAHVTPISSKELFRIVNPQAYVLFYVRKSLLGKVKPANVDVNDNEA